MNIRLLLLTCLVATGLWAADATGKWTADVPGRDGNPHQITLNLKADGAALTGTVGGQMGDQEIADGKVDGDNISFSVTREFNGNSVKMNYTGTVSGDEIKFKVEGGRGPAREFTAKRASS